MSTTPGSGFEVGIVGGGVHGASAAFHLARLGARTILLEQGELAGGPTGRSSAVCRAYYTNPFLARVARASLDLLADFAEHTGGRDAGHVVTGGLFLHGPSDEPAVRATAAALTTIGTTTEVLGPDELVARFPGFDPTGIAVAAFEHGAGHADPAATTSGLAARARELGAEVRVRTAVTGIAHAGGGAPIRLGIADGTSVEVDRLLIAAGPWTRPLAAAVGSELPLTVERHIVATFGWGRAEPVGPVFADVPAGLYVKPEVHGGFLVGPLTPEPTIDGPEALVDERLRAGEAEALAAAVVARVPHLEDVEPRGGWASLYDVSPDWQPVIGEVAERVFVDAGTSGHGFKLAPALGLEVARMVLGEPDPALAEFSPTRFERGEGIGAGWGEARILG